MVDYDKKIILPTEPHMRNLYIFINLPMRFRLRALFTSMHSMVQTRVVVFYFSFIFYADPLQPLWQAAVVRLPFGAFWGRAHRLNYNAPDSVRRGDGRIV